MYESDNYPFASDTITRTLYFARPLVTTKIKLDKMIGASGFVIQVEFIGMDQATKERHFRQPFEGGTVFKSETTFSDVLTARFVQKLIQISSGPDWLTFYDDQFAMKDGNFRFNKRLIENILDSGKIFLNMQS